MMLTGAEVALETEWACESSSWGLESATDSEGEGVSSMVRYLIDEAAARTAWSGPESSLASAMSISLWMLCSGSECSSASTKTPVSSDRIVLRFGKLRGSTIGSISVLVSVVGCGASAGESESAASISSHSPFAYGSSSSASRSATLLQFGHMKCGQCGPFIMTRMHL